MKIVRAVLLFIALFNPTQAYACGLCVDSNIQMLFPFLLPWIFVFLIWALVSFVICIIAKILKKEIDFVHAKRPGLALFLRLIFFIGLAFVSLGSLLFPFLIFLTPLWLMGIYKRIKRAKSVPQSGKIFKLHYYFNWLTVLCLVGCVVYSYTHYEAMTQSARAYLARKAEYKSTSESIR